MIEVTSECSLGTRHVWRERNAGPMLLFFFNFFYYFIFVFGLLLFGDFMEIEKSGAYVELFFI